MATYSIGCFGLRRGHFAFRNAGRLFLWEKLIRVNIDKVQIMHGPAGFGKLTKTGEYC